MIRLGIDLGGTKIEIIALNSEGKELVRQRIPTPQNDYAATLLSIDKLVRDAEGILGERGTIGIATPGALSRTTGFLKNSNSVCLNGQPIRQDLETLLQRTVRLCNDANCFALSEATDGAAIEAQVVFGVIIGTGTGAGIVVNGNILIGPNGIAGEWGHNPLPWQFDEERFGPFCYCGKSGCIETFLSGPGITIDHRQATGQVLEASLIAQRASAGDEQCENTMQRYENRLARSLAHVINILDPDTIVLGGGISNIKRLYKNVPEIWSQFVFSDKVDTKLVPPKFGDSSGVRGAAWLWNKP